MPYRPKNVIMQAYLVFHLSLLLAMNNYFILFLFLGTIAPFNIGVVTPTSPLRGLLNFGFNLMYIQQPC